MTYMLLLNCALKLVEEIILNYVQYNNNNDCDNNNNNKPTVQSSVSACQTTDFTHVHNVGQQDGVWLFRFLLVVELGTDYFHEPRMEGTTP